MLIAFTVDSINTAHGRAREGGSVPERAQWITTTEAAQRLGVKRATLYAYVSRGLLRSVRRPGQQESLFERSQIDALASASRPAGTPQPVLRFRSIATAVSSQEGGVLRYRGIPLEEVVATCSLEQAASLVLGDTSAAGPPAQTVRGEPPPGALAAVVAGLPLERRLPLAVQVLGASDPLADDRDPDRVRGAVLVTIPRAVGLMADAAGAPGPERDGLAALSLAALSGGAGGARTPEEVEVARVLLVTLLDHGLTASTVAARVAASTHAGVHACLTAAYAAMSGPLHGAAPVAAHALLADSAPATRAIGRALRDQGHVPGFGHFLYNLYPGGDPRAELVLTALWDLPGTARLRRRVDELTDVVVAHTGARPNIDLALAAVLHALGLPAAAGEVVFQIARSFGVAAHVLEEYAEEPLRWRGREAVG
jgi:citrate synthase